MTGGRAGTDTNRSRCTWGDKTDERTCDLRRDGGLKNHEGNTRVVFGYKEETGTEDRVS